MLVAATERGLCRRTLRRDRVGTRGEPARRVSCRANFIATTKRCANTSSRCWRRFAARRRSIDLPLDIRATAFQKKVWDQLRQIPRGETRSYTDIAREIGEPAAVRAVARACASNPVAITVPCHRVVRSDGDICRIPLGHRAQEKAAGTGTTVINCPPERWCPRFSSFFWTLTWVPSAHVRPTDG